MGNFGAQNSAVEKKLEIFHHLLLWIHFFSFAPAGSNSKVQTQL
jgi:hypothetical protein